MKCKLLTHYYANDDCKQLLIVRQCCQSATNNLDVQQQKETRKNVRLWIVLMVVPILPRKICHGQTTRMTTQHKNVPTHDEMDLGLVKDCISTPTELCCGATAWISSIFTDLACTALGSTGLIAAPPLRPREGEYPAPWAANWSNCPFPSGWFLTFIMTRISPALSCPSLILASHS